VKWIEEFGYVTIPVLALTAFAAIAVLLAAARSRPSASIAPVTSRQEQDHAGRPIRLIASSLDAGVVVTEYADLQCPFRAEYSADVLPVVIQDHVRKGDIRLELRLLRFVGPDSGGGGRAAHLAAQEDRMWDFVDLWYRNQGPEGTGYADDGYIRDLAEAAGVDSTPSVTVTVGGGEPEVLELRELTPEAFSGALRPHLEAQAAGSGYIRKTP
jgi:protein-disulfide isomerase